MLWLPWFLHKPLVHPHIHDQAFSAVDNLSSKSNFSFFNSSVTPPPMRVQLELPWLVTGCKVQKLRFPIGKGNVQKQQKTWRLARDAEGGHELVKLAELICYDLLHLSVFGSLSLSHLITSVLHTHVTCLEVIGGLQTLQVSMGVQIPSNQLSSTNSIQPKTSCPGTIVDV